MNLIATSTFSSQNTGGLEIQTEPIDYMIPLISLSGPGLNADFMMSSEPPVGP